MSDPATPRRYSDWRPEPGDRAEDAAHAFGFELMRRCRSEALAGLPVDLEPTAREAAQNAVDVALHNVLDLLEGYWRIDSGEGYQLDFALQVDVRDDTGSVVETQRISPSRLDLPIGYWVWAKEGEFR